METKHPDTCLFALAGSSGGRGVFSIFLARKRKLGSGASSILGAVADLPDGIQVV